MNIGAVERDTGLGKDTLRVWERRYGFPQPLRGNRSGERLYSSAQVERLRLIKRLIDQGHRPGRLFSASEDDLLLLASASGPAQRTTATAEPSVVSQILALLKAHDVPGLRHALNPGDDAPGLGLRARHRRGTERQRRRSLDAR